jgi:hypothetical protein
VKKWSGDRFSFFTNTCCTMEFYTAIKKNEIILLTGKWMELVNFKISKVSLVQKVKVSTFPLICGSWN